MPNPRRRRRGAAGLADVPRRPGRAVHPASAAAGRTPRGFHCLGGHGCFPGRDGGGAVRIGRALVPVSAAERSVGDDVFAADLHVAAGGPATVPADGIAARVEYVLVVVCVEVSAVQPVASGPAVQLVGPGAAGKAVVARTPIDHVVAAHAAEHVIAGGAVKAIVAVAAVDGLDVGFDGVVLAFGAVVSGDIIGVGGDAAEVAVDDHVAAATTGKHVGIVVNLILVRLERLEGVVSGVSVELVVASSTEEEIVAVLTVYDVLAEAVFDPVAAVAPVDVVVVVTAV